MVKFCVMRACANRDLKARKGLGVTHHVFPTEENVRAQWEEFVNKYNRTVGWKAGRSAKSAFLCTEHFELEFYAGKGGRLSKSAVPTKAPKFTAEVAYRHGLIGNIKSDILDVINDFEKSSQEILELGSKDVDPLSSLKDCEHYEDLVDMPMPVHIDTTESPNLDSIPGLTAAEIIRMPVVIDMPMRSPSPCPTEIIADEINYNNKENEPLLPQTGSFDSIRANAPSAMDLTPEKQKGRKRYAGDLEESDFISPRRRSESWKLVKATLIGARRRVRTLRQTVTRARKKIRNLESLLKHLQDKNLLTADVATLIKSSFPGPVAELLQRMLSGKRTDQYPPELTKFALTLNFHSPAAYSYVRDTFFKCLPHPKTISKYMVTRLCHDLKRLNETLITSNVRQKLTKQIIFLGQ